jgi:uncharacterized membrane protein
MNTQTKIAHGLGWFSLGLGAAMLIAPRRMSHAVGLDSRANTLRLVGLREIVTGLGILGEDRPGKWLWSRLAGDAMDIALLAAAPKANGQARRAAYAIAAVGGVALLDAVASVQHSSGDRRATSRSLLTGAGAQSAEHRPLVETIIINKPREEVFRFWRDLENLPRFMTHLVEVKETGGARSRWVAKGPMGSKVEWDAEIIQEHPGELIAWRSLPGATVENAGSVRFEPATGGRGTVVRVKLHYRPPAGAAGASIAKLFGEAPEKQIPVDLMRMKQLLETGEIARTEGQSAGRARSTSRKYDDWLRG